MDATGSEIYYLKEAELKLLLAGLGLGEWYGFFSEEPPRMDKKTENGLLAMMYQKGVIDWGQGCIAVRQPYADMLMDMLEKKICVTVQMPDSGSPLRCCYISAADVIVTQKSQREEASVGISKMSARNWFLLLREEATGLEDGERLALAVRNSENGRVSREICVRRVGIRGFRIDWEGGGHGAIQCQKEELPEKLGGLVYAGGQKD